MLKMRRLKRKKPSIFCLAITTDSNESGLDKKDKNIRSKLMVKSRAR